MDRSQAKPAASGPWDLLDCNTARRARQRRRSPGWRGSSGILRGLAQLVS